MCANVNGGNQDTDLPSENLLQSMVSVNNEDAVCCYDGGAEISLVTQDFVQRANLEVQDTIIECNDVVKRNFPTFGRACLEIIIQQKKFAAHCVIVKSLPGDLLLGRPWLKQNSGVINHKLDTIKLGRLTIQCNSAETGVGAPSLAAVSGRVRIPPNSVARVPFVLQPAKANVVYEVCGENIGGSLAVVPELIIPHNNRVNVAVVNLSDGSVSAKTLRTILRPRKLDVEQMPTDNIDVHLANANARNTVVIGSVSKSNQNFKRKLPENETEADIDAILSQVKIGPCDPETKKCVTNLLKKYHTIFSRTKWDIGRLKDPKYRHSIKLKEDAVPKSFAHYRVAQAELAIVRKFITKMRDAGLIDDSSSEWACPLLLIAKRDDVNERRPVINCKYLNSQQVCEATFLPHIDELIQQFSGNKKYISKLDLCQFFFQVELDEASKDICSFSTPVGNYRSNVMLQGDANAPSKAQKILTDILNGVDSAFGLIDDIAVADEKLNEHLEALEELFKRFLKAGLTLRADKVELLVPELSYLGFKLHSNGRMEITDDKIEVVKTWARCRSITEIRQFVGFTSFVRRFIRGYSQIAAPLLALLKKDKMSAEDWTPEVDKAFSDLKSAITSAPCLSLPSPNEGTMHLFSDSSDCSLGFVLAQEVFDKKTKKRLLKPCVFGSRLFRGSEKNYSIPQKEILGCVWSIKKNRPYLFGQTFRLHTDSEATYHVLKRTGAEAMDSRLSRFAFDVMDYHFHVHWVKSQKNWADPLSRLPVVKGPDGELRYRRDEEEVSLDPNPPPEPPSDAEIDPLWAGAVTRGQALDDNVGPGFREEQKNDEEIQELVRDVKASPEGRLKRGKLTFRMEGEVLAAVDKKRRMRYVIPANMVSQVIEREHTDAHLGTSKTLAAVSKKFYWKGQAEDVAAFVRGCFVCQTHKVQRPPTYPPLAELPRPSRAQQIAAIDVKGPIVPASNGKNYILVLVDVFSRYAWTKAVSRVDGPTVINFLVEDVIQVFGKFDLLISDNAANLKHGIAGFMYPHLGLDYANSLPYWPQSNGSCERLVGTIGKMIRCATGKNRQWSTVVKHVTSIYNGSVHRATGYAPQHLHMGYEAGAMPKFETEVPLHAVETPTAYLLDLQKQRADAEEAVLEGLRSYYEDSRAHYNQKRNAQSHKFYVGQWVLSKKLGPKESKSLGPIYEGPAEITKVTKSAVELAFLNSGIIGKRSVTHLKPYYEAAGEPTSPDRYTGPKRGEVRKEDDDGEEQDEELVGQAQTQDGPPAPGNGPNEVSTEVRDVVREIAEDYDEEVAQDPVAVSEDADNGQGGTADEIQDQSGNFRAQEEERQERRVQFDVPEDDDEDE